MKLKTLRVIVPLLVVIVVAVGFVLNLGTGTLSAFGITDISLICPLGALTAMVAQRMLIPRALVALVAVLVIIVLTGRLFCGWICPVPLVKRLPRLFKSKKRLEQEEEEDPYALRLGSAHHCSKAQRKACGSCDGCADVRAKVDSRHFVLGGAVLSAAIFGFPVFCLVCPIGLCFGLVFMVIALFAGGDVTWGIVAAVLLLALELLVFRKWCSHICPLSALMSLLAKVKHPVLKLRVDHDKCLETAGGSCGKCAAVCSERIDPRHLELGAGLNECIKCGACVEACPAHAITLPLITAKGGVGGTLSIEDKGGKGEGEQAEPVADATDK